MPRTLNLTGFKTGDNLNLSVSQGALTAGPVNVPSWGGFGDGGTITINTHRTNLQCAPDSVRFTVDLSGAMFDTAGPAGGEIYDPRMHDLIFLWDFDDGASGNWTAPVKVLPAWKNRNVAKGPFVAHMYTSPRPASGGAGTGYNVSVMVLEPSSGKVATASLEVFVEDPDTVYGGSGIYPDTVVVNPVGDDDWTGEPSGAQRINADTILHTDSWWTNQANDTGRSKRILFKRGGSFSMNVDIGGMDEGLYFGDYGDPKDPKPIINAIPTTQHDKGIYYSAGQFAGNVNLDDPAPDLRVSNLDHRGTLNPTTTRLQPLAGDTITIGSKITRGVDWIISNCDYTGLVVAVIMQPAGANNDRLAAHMHMDDCTMTDFGGQYPIYMGRANAPNSSVALTGCRFAQRPDAIDSDLYDDEVPGEVGRLAFGSRSPCRFEFAWLNHMRGCDFYHTDSSQPTIKFLNTPEFDGAIVNAHSSSFEHGATGITVNGTLHLTINRSAVNNVILDGLVFVAAWGSENFLDTHSTGVTLRNCLAIWPNMQRQYNVLNSHGSFIKIREYSGYDPTIVGAAPIRIYNNTFVTERTQSQNIGIDPSLIVDTSNFSNIVSANNIVHKPNMNTPVTTYASLGSDVLWTPRNIGRRSPADFTLQVTQVVTNDLVTPPDAVRSYRPQAGSAALGAALNGDVSYMDTTLKNRPEPPSIGAWEME